MESSLDRGVASADPGFSIQLQEPNRGYRPGQTIVGNVVHQKEGVAPQQPVVVTLTLHGLSKAKITSHKKYDSGTDRNRLPLVNSTYNLQPSIGSTPNTQVTSYPFAIPLPEKTQGQDILEPLVANNRAYWSWYPSEKHSDKGVFVEQAGESLPPTLRLGPRGSYIRSEGFVEYKLIAALSQVVYDGGLTSLEPLQHAQCGFWMVGAPAEPDYPQCKIDRDYWFFFKTYRLDPRIGMHTDLTWSQRSKMMRFASEVPAAVFFSNVWSDSLIDIGKEFNIKVSLTLPGPSFERPAKPEKQVYVTVDASMVEIESIRIQLRQEVRLRTLRYNDQWGNIIWEHTFSSADVANTLAPSRTDKNEPVWVMRCGPVPKGVVPTVRTGNISYTYTINVKVKTRCAGNDRSTQVNLYPVCRYASRPPQPKIKRKPVSGRAVSQPDPVDELADLGPYNTDPDEIPGSVKTIDTLLRGLNYAGKAGHIAHGVAGAVSMIF